MSDKPSPDDRIIDAEVEPLARARRAGIWRIVALAVAAIVISIAVAVVYQLWSTGRLDQILKGDAGGAARTEAGAPAAGKPPEARGEAAAETAAPVVLPTEQVSQALLSDQSRHIDDLEKRLSALTGDLQRLAQVPADPALDQQKLASLEKALADLRQADAAATAERAALTDRLTDLQKQLTAVSEARIAALRAPLRAVLAWSELREKARRGAGFAAELGILAQTAEGQSALAQSLAKLRPFAEQPPSSALQLAGRFAALAEAQRASPPQDAAAEAAAKPWWQRSLDKLSALISIRRVGSGDTQTPEGKLAAAAAALQAGDLAAAQAALGGMDLIPALAEWRRQAQARLDLEAALDAAGAALQAQFAQP
ncbi:MAG TPA: hypothetical protein VF194_17980 [Ferrovibrio sp.]|uniref:hypothetical protein n=1 Tax=Ferrovibrio sp. TaxID=1917215 RepID=UPI002ED40D3A